jgi:hypothetical protein
MVHLNDDNCHKGLAPDICVKARNHQTPKVQRTEICVERHGKQEGAAHRYIACTIRQIPYSIIRDIALNWCSSIPEIFRCAAPLNPTPLERATNLPVRCTSKRCRRMLRSYK